MVTTAALPNLGVVTDTVEFVVDNAGTGIVTAPEVRNYVAATFATTAALTAAVTPLLPKAGGALTGPLTSAQAGTFGNETMSIGTQFVLNGLSPGSVYDLTHAGKVATVGLLTGVAVPAGTAYEADAFAAYITNSSTTTGAAAGSFYALNLVAGSVSWALNPLVDDQGHLSTVMALECDVGASNVGSSAFGCSMLGVFPSGTPATAIAYQVSVLNSPWQYAHVSYDGACNNFALVGAKAATANSDGQLMQFNARDATNTVRSGFIQAIHTPAGADLVLTSPTGGVRVSGPFAVNGNVAIGRVTITGSRGGNAALTMLLTTLAIYGFITDATTA
jgi:hypothetical protein